MEAKLGPWSEQDDQNGQDLLTSNFKFVKVKPLKKIKGGSWMYKSPDTNRSINLPKVFEHKSSIASLCKNNLIKYHASKEVEKTRRQDTQDVDKVVENARKCYFGNKSKSIVSSTFAKKKISSQNLNFPTQNVSSLNNRMTLSQKINKYAKPKAVNSMNVSIKEHCDNSDNPTNRFSKGKSMKILNKASSGSICSVSEMPSTRTANLGKTSTMIFPHESNNFYKIYKKN